MSNPYADAPAQHYAGERQGVFNKECLYSTVQNSSGVAKTFGFLPPHGVKLAAGQEYTVFGNIVDKIKGRRSQIAFAKAVDEGTITILNTPAPILTDTGNGNVRQLTLHNGSLSAIAPCWQTSDSLEQVPA